MELARAYDSGNVGKGGKGGNVGKGGSRPSNPHASGGFQTTGKGGKGGKKRLASPSRDAHPGPIGARRTFTGGSSGGSAGDSSTGIGTPAERLSNLLLGSGEDPGLDCRAIIHIVKHWHGNIIWCSVAACRSSVQ